MSFPRTERAQPVNAREQWPGRPASHPFVRRGVYSEGIFVGYRGYQELGIEPLFPFGHGLSYTEFEYADLQIDSSPGDDEAARVAVTVRNVGRRPGTEILQVYVGTLPTSVPTPPRQLVGWAAVRLAPGDADRATIRITRRAVSYWDVERHAWVAPGGEATIHVGSSSADIRLTGTVRLG